MSKKITQRVSRYGYGRVKYVKTVQGVPDNVSTIRKLETARNTQILNGDLPFVLRIVKKLH